MEILTTGSTDLRDGPGVNNQLKEAGDRSNRKRLTETNSMLLGGIVQNIQKNLIINYFAAPERKGGEERVWPLGWLEHQPMH